MPPKPKAEKSKAGAAKKAKGPKACKLPDPFPSGEILKDIRKKEWKLGNVIGQGGFGMIYLASENASTQPGSENPFVIKIEPMANGPLFCELHFYQRVAKPETIEHFTSSKKLKYVGVPKFIAAGSHTHGGKQFRFMVMERFGSDLQKLFEQSGNQFPAHTVYCLGLRLLDALQYIHTNSYVHADIKASNLLLGFSSGKTQDRVYLVDYGLATKYSVDGIHRAYKEEPKKAHDGTIEFTSTDAHLGVSPSRRGDMEIMGYCLLQWLCGRLPWEDNLMDKTYVAQSKFKYMKDIKSLMKACFKSSNPPDEIEKYFDIVAKMKYEQAPDYDRIKKLLQQGLKKCGWKDEWNLGLTISPKQGTKRKSDSKGLVHSKPKQKKEPIKSSDVATPKSVKKAKTISSPLNGAGDSPTPRTKPVVKSSRKHATSPKSATPKLVKTVKSANAATPKQRKMVTASPKQMKMVTASPKQRVIPDLQSTPRGVKPPIKPIATPGPQCKRGTTTTKRRVKRSRVETMDVSMQTSPP